LPTDPFTQNHEILKNCGMVHFKQAHLYNLHRQSTPIVQTCRGKASQRRQFRVAICKDACARSEPCRNLQKGHTANMPAPNIYQRLYEGILASIPASVLLLDRQLRVVSANRNFLEKSHRSQESTVGQELSAVFPPVLLAYTRLEERVQKVFVTGRSEDEGEMTYRAPGLPTRVYFYRLTPIHDESSGQVEHVMLLMEDITERVRLGEEVRRAERHLASVVESANDIVISMDPNGLILTWNRTAEELTGYDRGTVQGSPMVDICVPEDRKTLQDLLWEMGRGRKSSDNLELILVARSGKIFHVAWSLSVMRNDRGAVFGLVAVGRDLTERREMEAQLFQSAKMASLGVMAGGIAHEIRNPLGICSAAAQLLQEHPEETEFVYAASAKIYTAVHRASAIIENLLKFARPAQNLSIQDHLLPLTINGIISDTVDLMTNEVTLRQIEIHQHLADDLPSMSGNQNLLQQVFTNLILNAINSMSVGGRLTVTTRTNNEQILIDFSDTGRGIDSQHMEHIFDPFYTTMPVGQGVGLGLSVSYAIIKQHRGHITVSSRVGQGSTFTVWLPIAGVKL